MWQCIAHNWRVDRRAPLGAGQVDFESGTEPQFAVDVDVAAALTHNAIHGRESQSRAGANPFGGIERLENLGTGNVIHPRPVVRYGKHYVLTSGHANVRGRVIVVDGDLRCFECDRATVGHRVAGIECEIQDYLFQLTGIGAHGPSIGARDEVNVYLLPDQAAQQRAHLRKNGVQVEDARLQHLLAAVGEQLRGERCRTGAGSDDIFHVAS